MIETRPFRGFTTLVTTSTSPDQQAGDIRRLYKRVTNENAEEIQDSAFPLYQRNLHKSHMQTSHRLEGKMEPGSVVGFAINPNGRRVAVTAYRLVDVHGLLVANIETTVVERDYQGKGIATNFARDIIMGVSTAIAFEEEDPQVYIAEALTARTPRTPALLAKRRTGFVEEDFPTQRNYPYTLREPLIAAIGPEIFDEQKRLRVNLTTGLWKNAYPFENGQDIRIDPNISPDAYETDQIWRGERIGMDPTNNDAVQYWCKIERRKVAIALRNEFPRGLRAA